MFRVEKGVWRLRPTRDCNVRSILLSKLNPEIPRRLDARYKQLGPQICSTTRVLVLTPRSALGISMIRFYVIHRRGLAKRLHTCYGARNLNIKSGSHQFEVTKGHFDPQFRLYRSTLFGKRINSRRRCRLSRRRIHRRIARTLLPFETSTPQAHIRRNPPSRGREGGRGRRMTRVAVNPALIRWARERAGLAQETLRPGSRSCRNGRPARRSPP